MLAGMRLSASAAVARRGARSAAPLMRASGGAGAAVGRAALPRAARLVVPRQAPMSWARMFSEAAPKIVYTYTDEAPMLATYSLLPVIRRFTDPAGIEVELSDISVAARILAQFPDRLGPEKAVPDALSELGELCKTPQANVIKLPNVSASIPQLQAAIAELQAAGYDVPDFVADAKTDEELENLNRYSKVLGSAVNPVLREGNSDRRAAAPVKKYAQQHPKKMGPWTPETPTHVAHMKDGDFFGSEQSFINERAQDVSIVFVAADGTEQVLKEGIHLQDGEVMDSARMSAKQLRAFLDAEISDAKEKDIMFSLHLKATMMKVSDPIMFGHCVKAFYSDVFDKYGDVFTEVGANPNNGIGDIYEKIAGHAKEAEIKAAIDKQYESRPRLAMVNSARGITNLHVPSDVIVDASMPNVVRDSGSMWNLNDELEPVKCVIPDRSYAPFYDAVFDDCRANGQFDPATMGHVSNVGLMAQKAEEYGSHDKTFEVKSAGVMRVVGADGKTIMEHEVEEGDIWRACQTKDEPIRAWVKLAIDRARMSDTPAIFWLDESRAHDQSLLRKLDEYLGEHDLSGLEISVMKPVDAVKESCTRARAGKDTISVTGNVLRDYLTDMFPILELGTSAKMLSIVPLLKGGGLFETGAGGSAPKHVQQFVEEGHLRWDSLGEYLAVAVSLEDLGAKTGNERATLLGKTLTEATGRLLDENKSPSRKVNELDNRGSTYYIARYWAEAMAAHDPAFEDLARGLVESEGQILQDLIDCQGSPVDIGGYYKVDHTKAERAMRPSSVLNELIGKDF